MSDFEFEQKPQNRQPSRLGGSTRLVLALGGIALVLSGAALFYFARDRNPAAIETPQEAIAKIESHISDGRFDLVWNRLSEPSRNWYLMQTAEGAGKARLDFITMQTAVSGVGKRPKFVAAKSTALNGPQATVTAEYISTDGKRITTTRKLELENGVWKLDVLTSTDPFYLGASLWKP